MVGRMRCLQAIQEWEELGEQAAAAWEILEPRARAEQEREIREEQAKAGRAPRPSVVDFDSVRSGSGSVESEGSIATSSSSGTASPMRSVRSGSNSSSNGDAAVEPATAASKNVRGDGDGGGGRDGGGRDGGSSSSSSSAREQLRKVAVMGAQSAWYLDKWEDMERYVEATSENELNGALYRVIVNIHEGSYKRAKLMINRSRILLDKTLSVLVGESYHRAYKQIVVVQMLAELEEILVYKKLQASAEVEDSTELRNDAENYLQHLTRMWTNRLRGCERSVDVWLRILSVRSLVLTPKEDLFTYIEFARICRKSATASKSTSMLSSKILTALGWTCPTNLLQHNSNNSNNSGGGSSTVPVDMSITPTPFSTTLDTGSSSSSFRPISSSDIFMPAAGVGSLVRGLGMNGSGSSSEKMSASMLQVTSSGARGAAGAAGAAGMSRHDAQQLQMSKDIQQNIISCHPRVTFAGAWVLNHQLKLHVCVNLTYLSLLPSWVHTLLFFFFFPFSFFPFLFLFFFFFFFFFFSINRFRRVMAYINE